MTAECVDVEEARDWQTWHWICTKPTSIPISLQEGHPLPFRDLTNILLQIHVIRHLQRL